MNNNLQEQSAIREAIDKDLQALEYYAQRMFDITYKDMKAPTSELMTKYMNQARPDLILFLLKEYKQRKEEQI